jgi:hypothetical protein
MTERVLTARMMRRALIIIALLGLTAGEAANSDVCYFALSGHRFRRRECPLSEVKPTTRHAGQTVC